MAGKNGQGKWKYFRPAWQVSQRISPDKVQDSFWTSQAGQQHLQKRTERTFPEFIVKVPGKILSEAGLRRHHKEPEPVKQIKLLKPRKHQ